MHGNSGVSVQTILCCNSSDSILRLHRRATILGRGNSANLLDSPDVPQWLARSPHDNIVDIVECRQIELNRPILHANSLPFATIWIYQPDGRIMEKLWLPCAVDDICRTCQREYFLGHFFANFFLIVYKSSKSDGANLLRLFRYFDRIALQI